jgi:hypothetical protein
MSVHFWLFYLGTVQVIDSGRPRNDHFLFLLKIRRRGSTILFYRVLPQFYKVTPNLRTIINTISPPFVKTKMPDKKVEAKTDTKADKNGKAKEDKAKDEGHHKTKDEGHHKTKDEGHSKAKDEVKEDKHIHEVHSKAKDDGHSKSTGKKEPKEAGK